MEEKPKSKRPTRNSCITAVQHIFLTVTATIFCALLLIYMIRFYKSGIVHKKAQHQTFLLAIPPSPILAKSKKIFEAFRAGDDETLKELLDSIDPEKDSEERIKVLFDYSYSTKPHLAHFMITSARLNSLQILLDFDLFNINELFLLHHVIKNMKAHSLQQDMLQLLMDRGADLNLADTYGFPPVATAILYSNLPALDFLTKNKAKINVAFARSPSMLHYAISRYPANLNIIKHLLLNGANVFHYGTDGRTAFHHILTMRPYNYPLIELFFDNHAPHIDKSEYITKLLNYPTSYKEVKKSSNTTRYGYTPLHIAISNYNTTLTKLLLSKGANPKKIDTSGLSAVELAKKLKQHKMIKIFQDK